MFTKIYDFIKTFIKEYYRDLIFITVAALLLFIELPFVIYTPGGLINLNKRITISNEYETKGSFNMTYVTLAKPNIPNILLAKIVKNWDIEDKDTIALDGDSVKETLKKDKYAMKEAQDNAVIAAYNLTDKTIKINNYHNYVYYVSKDAKTSIEEFDEILSINDKKITSLDDIKKIVTESKLGDILSVKVLRDNKEKDVTAKVFNTEDGLKIGIAVYTNIDYEADPSVSIKSKNSESGPSGGLMTSLAIYNKLTKEDITKGKKISGTGTIDSQGNIGEIGGVKYKLIGAVKKKSDIFICPKENYKEALKIAKKNNYNIKIITGDTLEEIIKKLDNITD